MPGFPQGHSHSGSNQTDDHVQCYIQQYLAVVSVFHKMQGVNGEGGEGGEGAKKTNGYRAFEVGGNAGVGDEKLEHECQNEGTTDIDR